MASGGSDFGAAAVKGPGAGTGGTRLVAVPEVLLSMKEARAGRWATCSCEGTETSPVHNVNALEGGTASGSPPGVLVGIGTASLEGCATVATAAESDASVAAAAWGGLAPMLPGSGGRIWSSFDTGAGGCSGGRTVGSTEDGAAAPDCGTPVTCLGTASNEGAGGRAGRGTIFAAGGRLAAAADPLVGLAGAGGDGLGSGAAGDESDAARGGSGLGGGGGCFA